MVFLLRCLRSTLLTHTLSQTQSSMSSSPSKPSFLLVSPYLYDLNTTDTQGFTSARRPEPFISRWSSFPKVDLSTPILKPEYSSSTVGKFSRTVHHSSRFCLKTHFSHKCSIFVYGEHICYDQYTPVPDLEGGSTFRTLPSKESRHVLSGPDTPDVRHSGSRRLCTTR